MSEHAESVQVLRAVPVSPRPPFERLGTGIAWLVILALVAFLVYRTARPTPEEKEDEELENVVWKMQARYFVGWKIVGGGQTDVYAQARSFNRGGPRQRLQFIVLAGELAGPGEALHQLANFDQLPGDDFRPTPDQDKVRQILGRLYRDHALLHLDGPSISKAERALLIEHLGWFGELALAPPNSSLRPDVVAAVAGAGVLPALGSGETHPDARKVVLAPANRTFAALLGGVCFMALIGFGGLVGLVIIFIFLARKKLDGGLTCGSTWGGVYAETFALWLLLTLACGWAARRLELDVPPLLLHSLIALQGLVVLVWPVLRGLSWRQGRDDLGLTLGRKPGLEPLAGIGCYAMSLPVVFVGLILTLLLQRLVTGQAGVTAESPVHPIVEPLSRHDWWSRVQVLFLACVVAPVVEEIMFRGVLYRHLREASCRLGAAASVLVSAVIVSLIFAAIHPQGLVAVPVLMALAFGFALTREWRVTLIPAMVAHGLSNGLVALMNILAQGG